jgi:hypothetical protein
VHILSPTAGSLYIDAGKPPGAQQYNRFDGLGRPSKPLSNIRNFTFDTPETRPYKRGSHGERGVPKTSRVLATGVFMTQMVPFRSGVSTARSCALCIVGLERDTPAAANVGALS